MWDDPPTSACNVCGACETVPQSPSQRAGGTCGNILQHLHVNCARDMREDLEKSACDTIRQRPPQPARETSEMIPQHQPQRARGKCGNILQLACVIFVMICTTTTRHLQDGRTVATQRQIAGIHIAAPPQGRGGSSRARSAFPVQQYRLGSLSLGRFNNRVLRGLVSLGFLELSLPK
ncbi:hypothetical protein F511_04441 [Dorcoceras hygrometricum]|uniref:Uncharacterized protein n=1 Tax=Dorcoceras hygrometricum TaxID=472368 RepID=A0A2Z7CQ23_9LAMI|nr:hypothetical protein F511_04441 [Dorcoceras hygrometricum]